MINSRYHAMKLLFYILFFCSSLLSYSQLVDGELLEDPNPINKSDEYEVIILDGKKILRSKYSKEIFNSSFQQIQTGEGKSLTNNWFGDFWDTTKFNPFKDTTVQYPISVDFTGKAFTMPVYGKITSRYGWRKGKAHKGIDIDLVTGDNVRVIMDGKVRFAKYYGGFGNVVVVRHANGLETIYAHLSKILVQPNTLLRSGQVIGKGGNTGHSRGSHLHFEVRYLNQSINPEYLFDFEQKQYYNGQKLYVDRIWTNPSKHRSYRKSSIVVRHQPNFRVENTAPIQRKKQPVFAQANTTPNNTGFVKEKSVSSTFRKQQVSQNQSFQKVEKPSLHVIKRGETIGTIASQYAITIDDICKLNQIPKSTILKVGAKLRVH